MMVTSRAFDHLDRLADFELLIGLVDDRRLGAAGADEDRADVRGGGVHQRSRRHFIGRRDHDEARRASRPGSDLLDAHLRRSVFADRDAAVRADHLQVHVRDKRPSRAAARSPCSWRKPEKLETNGILPAEAKPAPMATMLASAMPHEKKRSGNSLAK